MYRNRNIEKNMYLNYTYICNFKSVHILDSINKCHYNVFMLQLLCVSIIDSESGWEIE